MWRAISIARQPKTILGQCYVNTAHLTKASSKITTVITRGVVAVCIHHQGLVAVAFAPVFSEKTVLFGTPYHNVGCRELGLLNKYRDTVNGALTLSNAITSKERDCVCRNFCLKFLLAYSNPVQLGFSWPVHFTSVLGDSKSRQHTLLGLVPLEAGQLYT